MNPEPTNGDDHPREGKPIYGLHIRLEDDDADTTIRPSRYRDWMGPMRLQPVKEPSEPADADDQDKAGRFIGGVHLRLDNGEEWSVILPNPAEDDVPPLPQTEVDPNAK